MQNQLLPVTEEEKELLNYQPDFERLWKCFMETEKRGLGKRGRKKPARAVFDRINPDAALFRQMIEALRYQAASKLYDKRTSKDGFFEPFQHCERWLRNETWNDLPVTPEQEEQNRFEEIRKKHTDRSWHDGNVQT